MLFRSNKLNNSYFAWAVKNLANCKQLPSLPLNLYLIIGSEDGIFSIKKAINPIIIEGGDHMMVFKKHKEVSMEIRKILV